MTLQTRNFTPRSQNAACVLVLFFLLSSCASHSQVAHTQLPVLPIAMDQQIQNAVDAGEGDYELRTLRERLMAQPDNAAVRIEVAKAYEKRGYPEIALDHYRLAVDLAPNSPDANLLLAKMLKKNGHTSQAIQLLERFTVAHPVSSAEVYSWLGILLDENKEWKSGEKAHRDALKAAIAVNKDRDYLHNNLGYSLLEQGKNEDAIVEFRAALKLNARSVIARDNLGLALVATPKEAILNWQSLNEPAIAHSNLAAILIEQHKYPEARKELQIALEYNNSNPAALANLKLLSDLDGKPVTIPTQNAHTRWSRIKTAWHQMFAETQPRS